MLKSILFASIFATSLVSAASADPVYGSFSLQGISGAFVGGGSPTALTATGIDFGTAFSGTGNGFPSAGTATVSNGTGDFFSYNGSTANLSDLYLQAATASLPPFNYLVTMAFPYLVVNTSTTSISRSPTSITVTGTTVESFGIFGAVSTGTFSLVANSQAGSSALLNSTFTFASDLSPNAVPEPMSMSILGAGLLGMGAIRMRRKG